MLKLNHREREAVMRALDELATKCDAEAKELQRQGKSNDAARVSRDWHDAAQLRRRYEDEQS